MDNSVYKNKLINMEFFTHQKFGDKAGQITEAYLEYIQKLVKELGPYVKRAMEVTWSNNYDFGFNIEKNKWEVTLLIHDEVTYHEYFDEAVDVHQAMMKLINDHTRDADQL